MSQPIPFVIYSDGPRLPTGLARITRDLTARLHAEQEALGIAVLQVGYDPLPGPAVPWPLFSGATLDTEGDWGAGMVSTAWMNYFGDQRGVLWSIWDPSRAFPLLDCKGPSAWWGYVPIDGVNVNGSFGGPAAEMIRRYDRILAYGRWASTVLRGLRSTAVQYLPHGIDLGTFTYVQTQEVLGQVERIMQKKDDEIIIGSVTTNQPRKDLGLYFATLAELRRRGHKVRGWLHTDAMIRAWSVPQLASDFGLNKKVTATLSLSNEELAACYSLCGCTFAPGSGEGFGFPIVESLACGTPCVHVNYAGGAELVPMNAWRVPFHAERLDGLYGIRRPVVSPVDAANAIERALDFKRNDERVCQAFCRGAVEYLDWKHIWPRFRSWVKAGFDED